MKLICSACWLAFCLSLALGFPSKVSINDPPNNGILMLKDSLRQASEEDNQKGRTCYRSVHDQLVVCIFNMDSFNPALDADVVYLNPPKRPVDYSKLYRTPKRSVDSIGGGHLIKRFSTKAMSFPEDKANDYMI